tara:strand:+ start:764 stop:1582 length:819 start_codon:yes stop_codon:yes gene_type:complete
VEITDNHFHLDPFGKKELAVKEFLRAGGTRLVLVHKPYASWKKIEAFKEQVETTIKLSKRAREAGAKVAVVAAPHPVQFVKLLEHYDNTHASDIYLEAVDFCINLVEEKVTVGLGELGRPHFDVDSSIWESANSLLSESLSRAKEVEAAVVLHTESGTPEVMSDLSKIADGVKFPKSRLVKHYGGPGAIEEPHDITVSLISTSTNIAQGSKINANFMLETDYLDDPNRPGAVMGPKTVPRKSLSALEKGIISENQFFDIHSRLPDTVYQKFS